MFDPPDYPYKDLADSLRDDLLFSNECTTLPPINLGDTKLINEENKSFQQNDSGRFFNNELISLGTVNAISKDHNAELLVLQSENYSPTLLDENTVNQFLLPLQDSSGDTNKNGADDKGPDLLALQSCVLCHEIFITEADLLDHTISVHTCDDGNDDSQNILQLSISNSFINTEDANSNTTGFETEWLVCGVCDRVLSTAQEVEPTDQLCCSDNIGNARVTKRSLDTMYVCDICSGLFAGGESLDKHKGSCLVQNEPYKYTEEASTNESIASPQCPNVLFTCDLCEKRCESAAELKSHLNTCDQFSPAKNVKHSFQSRANSKMWNCGSCNQLFATARELYRHKRGEDRPPGAPLTAFVCEECDKVLGSMCALHTHRKMHKVTKPGYPCRICGRRFNQSGHLAIHMRMHTGERPYPCDLCPKAFKVKVERDDHRRTHTGERPFACTACPKTFTAAARLREHARIHTDQRPYRCEICGAAFRRPYARTVHTLIHTGEKPHECDVCGTAFRRSGDMWKHKRTIHGTQLAFDEGKTM